MTNQSIGDWRRKIETAPRLPLSNHKHVVALSGGKDSSAMALALKMFEPADYTFVCTPTGDELPEMDAHWLKLEGLLSTAGWRTKAR